MFRDRSLAGIFFPKKIKSKITKYLSTTEWGDFGFWVGVKKKGFLFFPFFFSFSFNLLSERERPCL